MQVPGELLEATEIAPDVAGSRAWAVRFASEDLFGRPTESTGIIAAPDAAGLDRPVVVWCHGTTGLGDSSVPSRQPNPAGELITYPEPVAASDVDRGVPGMAAYLAAGAVVVAPDYQGLGTPGFHHYCVHATGARDAVNSVRAARSLADVGAGERFGALGWSEGGGMALGVAELPGRQLEGLDLRAVATFAPGVPGVLFAAAGPAVHAAGAAGDPHVLMLLAVHGWLFDDLDPLDVLTAPAARLMDDHCEELPVHLIGERAARLAGTGELLRDDPQRSDVWAERLLSVSAGTSCAQAPIYIATGTTDTTVPPDWQGAYVDAARLLGSDVTQELFPGDDHCEVPFTASSAAQRFLIDRLGV